MTLDRQICKCGTHEIDPDSKTMSFGNYTAQQTASDVLNNAKIILKTYKFNVHYQVGRDEWHFQQFDTPKEVATFCRNNLRINQIYKIFHQISACLDGRVETVARHINLHTCRQMVNDKNVFQQNNIQTACKLVLKLWSSNHIPTWNTAVRNNTEVEH